MDDAFETCACTMGCQVCFKCCKKCTCKQDAKLLDHIRLINTITEDKMTDDERKIINTLKYIGDNDGSL